MLEKMRWRLTLGYAGIFALILIFLAMAALRSQANSSTTRPESQSYLVYAITEIFT